MFSVHQLRLFLLFLLTVSVVSSLMNCGVTSTNRFAIKVAKAQLWNEAAFRWQQVTAEKPEAAFAHNNLGVAYEASGKIEKAIAAYQKAVKIEPDNKHYRYNYRRCRSIHKDRSDQKQNELESKVEKRTSRPDDLEIDEIHP